MLKEVNEFLGSGIRFSSLELARRRAHLKKRLYDRAAWFDPARRAKRETARAHKRQTNARTPEYVRTEAGMEAAIAAPSYVPTLSEDDGVDEAVTEVDRENDDTARGVDSRVELHDGLL